MVTQPCPKCRSMMLIRSTRACSEYGSQFTYYFLDCARCGHGPTTAFDSEQDAINDWNAKVEQTLNVVG